ncbi:hypothetical protein BU26DRAFT_31236 [Trematosphaeria pertusa]|uniref:Uncharacterized protein n=1 Tax=Trematosphaeria pertusa TaxID=390896 RepID=A0A6A6J5X5_9PLEO|nr:uncharacterized protein BU26DRAFT_31236 [Trematosphaeria pertusa]KAF2256883.1 hypothetical protein BU26DRAFT_31236 [Trematosphaeria pertusa]
MDLVIITPGPLTKALDRCTVSSQLQRSSSRKHGPITHPDLARALQRCSSTIGLFPLRNARANCRGRSRRASCVQYGHNRGKGKLPLKKSYGKATPLACWCRVLTTEMRITNETLIPTCSLLCSSPRRPKHRNEAMLQLSLESAPHFHENSCENGVGSRRGPTEHVQRNTAAIRQRKSGRNFHFRVC